MPIMVFLLLTGFGLGEDAGPADGLGMPAARFAPRLDSRALEGTDGTDSSGATTTPGFFPGFSFDGADFFAGEADLPGLLLAAVGADFLAGGAALPGLLLPGGGVTFFAGGAPSATAGGSPVGGLADLANSASASLSLLFESRPEGWLLRALRRAAKRSEKRPRFVRGARLAAEDSGVPAVLVFCAATGFSAAPSPFALPLGAASGASSGAELT